MSLFDVYFYSVIADKKYMLLDGYPRSIPQLNAYLTKSHDYEREIIGIYFDISEEEAIRRMLERGRAGESEEVIRTRLEKYYKFTQPIKDAFAAQQRLITIDASGDIDAIHQEVVRVLEEANKGL
ncbi:MAG: nucleoside monophosphate kinase [Candidatus Peribacteria bacterium]|nr:MAG: nucleoside monophosphate kinase [Candidatus Peribacteria bacterium]